VRRFIYDLRSPALAEVGLFPAIAHYADDYQKQFGIAVRAQISDNPWRLPASAAVAVFRIVQEALQNVRKHAAASSVGISAEIDGNALRFSIEDDGRGFDVPEVNALQSRNFGLTSMRERADLIGADLQLVSSPGHATRVTLVVPLE